MKFKFKLIVIALGLAVPLAHGQSVADLKNEIELLKTRLDQLETQAKALQDAGGSIDREEFNRIKTKAETLEDQKETSGFKGVKISGSLDPTYVYSRDKHTSSFAFLNNFTNVNGSGETAGYDNSYFGLSYIDIQKQTDSGTIMRMTIAPSKSAGSGYNFGNIVHEATASIPLTDAQTRLIVGQIPDVSGYELFFNNHAYGTASGVVYGNHTITHNLLYDFTEATFYTGIGLDIKDSAWEAKGYLANFNAARYDINAPAYDTLRSPALIYNFGYFKDEFWGFEFTGYEGRVPNLNNGGYSRLDQFEIDGNFNRGNIFANAQATIGRQKNAAFNGGDASWWGFSAMLANRFTPTFEAYGRADYLNNSKNGGGTFAVGNNLPQNLKDSNANNTSATALYAGDFNNGFGPGDPTASSYDPNKGANRTALTVGLNWLYSPNVTFRGEFRQDWSSVPSFYKYKDGSFSKTNQLFSTSAIIDF